MEAYDNKVTSFIQYYELLFSHLWHAMVVPMFKISHKDSSHPRFHPSVKPPQILTVCSSLHFQDTIKAMLDSAFHSGPPLDYHYPHLDTPPLDYDSHHDLERNSRKAHHACIRTCTCANEHTSLLGNRNQAQKRHDLLVIGVVCLVIITCILLLGVFFWLETTAHE
ncbi:uncharacterized protein BDZ99DRAFT_465467 [Mytilinidion resinicola]|uniref:Uncharacterized protein n=1 Tax=Mytilinidion resinicola TaxID=574789 RepID=A0A6A6YF76_9PEZI|nr:uncharacterized protein BDZ99DRAFT_465467 [Mytilinidion resinicola]KAF2806674.1 hypothetical protein BDZ99DRAFT_465467 [Mytilinidion resinicola]